MITLSGKHGLAIDRRLVADLLASDRSVIITGASGWLSAATLAMLDASLPSAFVQEKLAVFGSSRRTIVLPSGRSIVCQPLEAMATLALERPLVLHYAYVTKDKVSEMSDRAFSALNGSISEAVRTAAARWKADVFLPSSGGVYRRGGGVVRSFEESPYGYMKLADERLFRENADAAGTSLFTGRIFSLAGEFINKTSIYALGSIIAAIESGDPVRIKATQGVWRSYFYVGDVVNLALGLLLSKHAVAEPFDIAGSEPVEIGELAVICAEVCGDPAYPIERPVADLSQGDRMLGDAEACLGLMRNVGLKPMALRDQVAATARYLLN